MGFSSGSLILVVQLPLLFTFGSWVAPHCTGRLTGMNQCVLTEVRKSERQLMNHLYCGLCSEMSPVPLVSGGEGSCVTVSDGRPLRLYVLFRGTHTVVCENICTHTRKPTYARSLAKTTQQLQCRHDGGDTQPSL